MDYQVLELDLEKGYAISREEFPANEPLPQYLQEVVDRQMSATREAIHAACVAAGTHGIGVVKFQAHGSHIFATDESALYHKIMEGMK